MFGEQTFVDEGEKLGGRFHCIDHELARGGVTVFEQQSTLGSWIVEVLEHALGAV